ncbi:MAG: TlpA family protein disulfide reductase [Bacteroidia bacterium]
MKTVKKGLWPIFLVSVALSVNKVGVKDFAEFEKSVQKNNDTLYVVNVWATWCVPCVKEMPFFFQSAKTHANEKVKIVFASLNSLKELEKVQAFADKKNIAQDVFILNAGNPNDWIDKVDKSWGGSIPATVMYKKSKKVFFREGDFSQTELDSIINLNK